DLVQQLADLGAERAVKKDVPLAEGVGVDMEAQPIVIIDDSLDRMPVTRGVDQAYKPVGPLRMEVAGGPGEGGHEGVWHGFGLQHGISIGRGVSPRWGRGVNG